LIARRSYPQKLHPSYPKKVLLATPLWGIAYFW
jgi:hypothetical protein